MKRYVLMVGLTADLSQVAMLRKLRGPAKLIGKLNFPGGHIEEGENAREAAIREFAEETGIQVSIDDVHFLHFTSVPGEYSLSTYYVASDAVAQARTCTDEEVHLVPVTAVTQADNWADLSFCPGTPQTLRSVVHRLSGVAQAEAAIEA